MLKEEFMFKIALIVFREFMEIALVIGLVAGMTKNILNSRIYITLGALFGLVFASLLAFFVSKLTVSSDGFGDEILDASIILFTCFTIGATIIWIKGYIAKVKQNLNELSEKISSGVSGKFALTFLVMSLLMREGTEIILLIYSISSVSYIEIDDYLIGIGIGSFSGVLVGIMIYFGFLKISSKYIFQISSIMLTFIAAGLAADAAGILTSSGVIKIFNQQLWDSSWLIKDDTILGETLKILAGYQAKPNILQAIFYLLTIVIIFIMSIIVNKRNS